MTATNMKIFIYLTLLFALLGGNVYANTQLIATIQGQVFNPRAHTIKLESVTDYITHEPMEYEVQLDAQGKFKINITAITPKPVKLYHGHSSIHLFVEPGQALQLTFDAWDMRSTVKFTGDGADNNAYYNKAHDKFARYSDANIIYRMSALSPDDFKADLQQIKAEKQQFLDQSSRSLRLTTAFRAYAQADIDYWWVNQLMKYRWEHALYNDMVPPMQLPYSYYSFLKSIPLNNDDAITNPFYLTFLEQYLDFQVERSKRIAGASYQALPYRGANTFLEGKAREYILASEFYLSCNRDQTYLIGNDVKQFLEEAKVTHYKTIVRNAYKKANGLEAGAPAPNFTLTSIDGEQVSLKDFRGKVVYVDFWATWCVPCTYEILQSKELKKKFQGREVVFLYISLDTNIDNWRDFIQKHELKGVHLYAQNLYESDVATEYGVRGLPSFFLIDKDGRLARVPAKRSSEAGVVSEINDVLSK